MACPRPSPGHRPSGTRARRHIIHSLQEAGLKRWVALQEGAGYTLGWLTVRLLP